MALNWRDKSSWSQSDGPEVRKTPTAWEIQSGSLRVTIHHYVGMKDTWLVSCHAIGVSAQVLKSKNHRAAGREAIAYVRDHVKRLAADARGFTRAGWP